ncbi:hypothetical protein [Alteromonas lipolytica]|uniref:DUF1439 domain-containing protein n=1 Tax=Alteromonas lipolytica TaxID=1856405 RepID=A0A1E8FC07_9ALTE|nr:hypothetical protein [Alteromonas lipolytica]OFI33451.1 hypothetical protein BFC17_04110 [Alteromonas lipolytica]GGF59566.1 hypothetical protein GCM10011338_09780 [Alteromonas lipolytica]
MKYLRRLGASLLAMLVLYSPVSNAFIMTFSESQLNAMVTAVFPQQRTFDNVIFTFSEPYVELDPLDDEVNVKVTILAEQNGQQLKAKAEISGKVAYHYQLAQLRLIEPQLDKLKVLDNQAVVPESLVNGIKRLEGKRMPVILLLDFEELDMAAFGIQKPKRIDITPKGLLIEI